MREIKRSGDRQEEPADLHLQVPGRQQRRRHLQAHRQRRMDHGLLARRALAELSGDGGRGLRPCRGDLRGELPRQDQEPHHGRPSRHGLPVLAILRRRLDDHAQRSCTRGRDHGRRQPDRPLPREGAVPPGLGRDGGARQLPLHHRLPSQPPPALLGQRRDGRPEVPRHRTAPYEDSPTRSGRTGRATTPSSWTPRLERR